MVATEVGEVIRRLDEAVEPEDFFGDVEDLRDLRGRYRWYARIVHPDRNGGDEDAARAFRRLTGFSVRAEALIREGTYGADRGQTFRLRTRRREYLLEARIATGDVCDVFRARWDGGQGVAKVVRHPRDNDLVQAEASTLRALRRDLDERWLPFLPDLVDATGFRAKGGIVRRANVLDGLDGFVSLERVATAYPSGIDPRDMAWMLRRLLSILGAVHRAGVVHAAVTPASVLIHPEEHGLVLADWEYAVPAGTPPRIVNHDWRRIYPPELAERRHGAEADIYTAAQTMLYLLNPESRLNRVSTRLPRPMRAFFRACALPERKRPDDAWKLAGYFDEILERCYGPRRFRPFTMPTTEGRS